MHGKVSHPLRGTLAAPPGMCLTTCFVAVGEFVVNARLNNL